MKSKAYLTVPRIGMALLTLILTICATSIRADGNDRLEAIIKHRQAVMKSGGEQMRVLAAFVKSGNGEIEPVTRAIDELKSIARQTSQLFPPGTGMDDELATETGARPEIWSDPDEFAASVDALIRELDAFAGVIDSGDDAALASRFRELGRTGCSGCHERFREKI